MTTFDWENGEQQIEVSAEHLQTFAELQASWQECQAHIDAVMRKAHAETKDDRQTQRVITENRVALVSEVTGVDVSNLVEGGWNCKFSPTQRCWYDTLDDPWRDNCLFCALPSERK